MCLDKTLFDLVPSQHTQTSKGYSDDLVLHFKKNGGGPMRGSMG